MFTDSQTDEQIYWQQSKASAPSRARTAISRRFEAASGAARVIYLTGGELSGVTSGRQRSLEEQDSSKVAVGVGARPSGVGGGRVPSRSARPPRRRLTAWRGAVGFCHVCVWTVIQTGGESLRQQLDLSAVCRKFTRCFTCLNKTATPKCHGMKRGGGGLARGPPPPPVCCSVQLGGRCRVRKCCINVA